jgi:hypothetical protein
MPEIYSDELVSVIGKLILAGVVYLAFTFAKDAADKRGRWDALWKGTAWCVGIAVFGAMQIGEPSCAQSDDDPLRGGCVEYADDGYSPGPDQRYAKFLGYVVLLLVPVSMGVGSGRRHASNPWRRPQPPTAD